MQTLISQRLAWNHMTGRRTLIPPQANLSFLVQHWKTNLLNSFENHLEMLVHQCTTTLHGAQASHAFLLYEFPPFDKKQYLCIQPQSWRTLQSTLKKNTFALDMENKLALSSSKPLQEISKSQIKSIVTTCKLQHRKLRGHSHLQCNIKHATTIATTHAHTIPRCMQHPPLSPSKRNGHRWSHLRQCSPPLGH